MTDNRSDVVAIVDDDHGARESLKFLLETFGLQVTTFASAAAFLADRAFRPACLLLDHHMPHTTGLDLAALLLAEGAGIPLLLMSGAPSPAMLSRATQLGIETVLIKPLDEGELMKFIRSHI